jgi:hypothetical protein
VVLKWLSNQLIKNRIFEKDPESSNKGKLFQTQEAAAQISEDWTQQGGSPDGVSGGPGAGWMRRKEAGEESHILSPLSL